MTMTQRRDAVGSARRGATAADRDLSEERATQLGHRAAQRPDRVGSAAIAHDAEEQTGQEATPRFSGVQAVQVATTAMSRSP